MLVTKESKEPRPAWNLVSYARKHIKQNARYQKKYYDTKATTILFGEGQAVWLYDASKKEGVCSKLTCTCKWKGPYIITKRIDDITFLVKRSEKQRGKVYHIDRLLPYKGRYKRPRD